MEEGCGSWFPQQLHCLNLSSLGRRSSPTPNNGNFPPPPCRWFCRLRQPCDSSFDPRYMNCLTGDQRTKKFLVFDQSGDQTTMIFTCGIGSDLQTSASKTMGAINMEACELEYNSQANPQFLPDFPKQTDTVGESDMHEDTEELNALLYSDDDDAGYYSDDEVSSTGHSPGTAVAVANSALLEEVASSDGSSRKRKRNPNENGDRSTGAPDAESQCGFAEKRGKRERIRETVTMLQNIIPGPKSNDPLHVLDEAIEYLKRLKHKAEALSSAGRPP